MRHYSAQVRALVVLALIPSGCMLITSPGDFTQNDSVTKTTTTPDAGKDAGKHPTKDSGSDAPSACADLVGESTCATCVANSCCDSYNACENDNACVALLDCATGDSSCINDNQSGQAHANALNDCLTNQCPICSEAGIGDPCGTGGVTCATGLTCTGLWCTKSCAGDSDCAGIYMNGENASGGENRCAINGENAAVCFPGCATTADCGSNTGTTCLEYTASVTGTTDVCATSSSTDGGFDGETDFDAGPDAGMDATLEAGTEGGASDAHAGG